MVSCEVCDYHELLANDITLFEALSKAEPTSDRQNILSVLSESFPRLNRLLHHTSINFHPTFHPAQPISRGMNYIQLTQTLVDSFNALADEVQTLTDRKTILEHKLRFAHEQFQYLADKHAPAAPEISETLAKLQLPPELHHPPLEDAKPVPLPLRTKLDVQHQIALIIRDGRRVAQQLTAVGELSKTSDSSRETLSRESRTGTSMSTALEQDFTIEGKKSSLACPFSAGKVDGVADVQATEDGAQDHTPHQSADPICAAMYEETMSQPAPAANGSAAKCPIRFLDQHSPEEIAHYVETHKHELPRSHGICVQRYQKNEDQIKKLDAKYGNLVSMIQGLSALHQPMLPEGEQPNEIDRASNERVESWAQGVSAGDVTDTQHHDLVEAPQDSDDDRQSHFDRPLKEVRVGESPSRPWGISVPVYELPGHEDGTRPLSPPPAPVFMPSSLQSSPTPAKPAGKCPFDHTKLAGMNCLRSSPPKIDQKTPVRAHHHHMAGPFTPPKQRAPSLNPPQQPTFINPEITKQGINTGPQMVFTGPVFIGYPMEQAIQFMQHLQRS